MLCYARTSSSDSTLRELAVLSTVILLLVMMIVVVVVMAMMMEVWVMMGGKGFPILYVKTPDRPPQRLLLVVVFTDTNY